MSDLADTKRQFLSQSPLPRDKLARLRFYRRGYIDAFRQDFHEMPTLRKIVRDCGAADS